MRRDRANMYGQALKKRVLSGQKLDAAANTAQIRRPMRQNLTTSARPAPGHMAVDRTGRGQFPMVSRPSTRPIGPGYGKPGKRGRIRPL